MSVFSFAKNHFAEYQLQVMPLPSIDIAKIEIRNKPFGFLVAV